MSELLFASIIGLLFGGLLYVIPPMEGIFIEIAITMLLFIAFYKATTLLHSRFSQQKQKKYRTGHSSKGKHRSGAKHSPKSNSQRSAKKQRGKSSYQDETSGNSSKTKPHNATKHSPKSSPQISAKKQRGTMTFYDEIKGFGFIESEQREDSVFIHISAVEERDSLEVGEQVEFDIVKSERGFQAINAKIIQGNIYP